jgi:RNA polymerase-binding transcription factor DksA
VEERYESELAQSTRVLNDVDRALERLSDGTYHSCEACVEAIPDAALAADPTRRVCDQHAAPVRPSAPDMPAAD